MRSPTPQLWQLPSAELSAAEIEVPRRLRREAFAEDEHAGFSEEDWKHGLERTADEDGYILVLPTSGSPELDLTDPIGCEWRPGDVW